MTLKPRSTTPRFSTLRLSFLGALLLGAAAASCSEGSEPGEGIGGSSPGGSAGNSTGGSAGALGGSSTGGVSGQGGSISLGGSTAVGGSSTGGSNGQTCASQKAVAELLPVRLAFAFDVSGSMGKHDFPWHDPALKWDPVVEATRGFFEHEDSAGLEASLTAFPVADDDEKCEDSAYEEPIVPMTALPSTEFGAALDEIRAGEWRGGTPTVHVVNGVLSYIAEARAGENAKYVFVLVTDGYPQDCDDDNSIPNVVDAVAAVADEIPTYVIGVANPPLTDDEGNMAPETVMDLSAVAVAGGTDQAYIIDTGNAAATRTAFTEAVNEIRGSAISCELDIPPIPDGREFERDKVAVTYTSDGTTVDLTYDATCAEENSWHYDDPIAPMQIVLCESTCGTVQADEAAVLDVTFTCESVIDPR